MQWLTVTTTPTAQTLWNAIFPAAHAPEAATNHHRWFPGEPQHLSYVVRKYEQGGLSALDA